MSHLLVATSTTKDGNMYNRHDPTDQSVIKNRRAFLKKHGISMQHSSRVRVNYDGDNFCRYITIDDSRKGHGMLDSAIEPADALIITRPNHALILPVADCIATVIYDPEHSVLMVSHLGRHSLEQHGAQKSIEYLVGHFESDPSQLQIYLSPSASKENYPIWALNNMGLKEAAHQQLTTAGISPQNINDNTAETDKDPLYYSYSEYQKGRQSEDADFMVVAMIND